MDIYQLRYFLEVARELSFTRAAANLFISPPALSRSVALLESSLKTRLFHRTKRRVSLTAEGAMLKAGAEKAFEEIEAAKLELRAGGPEELATLRIGSREMITDYLLTGPLKELKGRYPGARVGLFELSLREMADALRKDRVDVGFYYSGVDDPALQSVHLGRLRSHIYAKAERGPGANASPKGARHGGAAAPASRRGAGTLAQALKLPFVAPRYFHAEDAETTGLDGFPDHRIRRDIRYEAEFLETHRRFVLEGLAAAVLPDLVIADEYRRGRVMRFQGPAIFREIYFLKRRARPLPKAVDALISGLRRCIAASRS